MSDTDTLPADLLDLERARVAARRVLDEFVCAVEVRRRADFPGDEQVIERRRWPAAEEERLAGLQAGYRRAADAVRAHPLLVAADAERKLWAQEERLRREVPQVLVVVRRDAGGVERVVTMLGGVDPEAE